MFNSSFRSLQRGAIGVTIGLWMGLPACGGNVSSESSGGGGSSGTGGSGGSAACERIAAPQKATPQQGSASGSQGQAVIGALAEVFAAQSPPIVVGPSYSMGTLSASNLWAPDATPGYHASVVLDLGGGTTAEATAADALAQSLFETLSQAGTHNCDDPAHGEFIRLSNVNVDVPAGKIDFDDVSSYAPPLAPDLLVKGAAAKGVLDAFATAGIVDCDAGKKVFLVCNKFGDSPSCGYDVIHLDLVDGSELINACTPATVDPGPALTNEGSVALWNAMIAAAKSADVSPPNGTLDQATVINAGYFQWDGETLGCHFVVDTVTPPGP